MTIIEKHIQRLPLTKEETEKEKGLLLLQLAKIKQITNNKLDEKEKQELDNALSILMIYYPENWKDYLFKGLGQEIVDKLIKEEPYLL